MEDNLWKYIELFFTLIGIPLVIMELIYMYKEPSIVKRRRIYWGWVRIVFVVCLCLAIWWEHEYAIGIQAMIAKEGLRVSECTHFNSPGRFTHTSQFTIQTINEINYSPIKIRIEFSGGIEECRVATFSYNGINSNLLYSVISDDKTVAIIVVKDIGFHAVSPLVVDIFSKSEVCPINVSLVKD